ncbi:MAG: transporter substrate-binding domain-containing protein [Desulfovibrionaceae bacterium]|nr:transporter substrate-binding domain-containing protein [Desulfovibrionaceae bacterium]
MHTIKVGVYINPPFVMTDQSGHYYGLAVDLWEMADERLGLETEYIAYPSFKAFIDAAISGEVDMVIGNIAATYERAKHLKFSYPWYDTGLRIMIKGTLKPSVWEEMKKSGQLENYFWIALLFALLAVGQTLLRRRVDPEFPKTWREGLSYSLYELILAARLGIMQRNFLGWFGYILLVAWMIFGVAMVAYVVSSITNAMTISSFRAESMNSLAYLPGQRVGVLSGTVGEHYLRQIKVTTIPFNSIPHALEALEKGELEALVDDAPVLEYWAHKLPQARLDVVGPPFNPGKYAFASNKSHAQFMDKVSEELIRLHELGLLDMLKSKYLGKSEY